MRGLGRYTLARRSREAQAGGRRRWAWTVVAAVVGLAVGPLAVVALGPAPGTWALWNHSAEVSGTTIRTGTLGLSITPGGVAGAPEDAVLQIPATTWSAMLPGQSVGFPVTVTNTGTTAAALRVALDPTTAAQSDVAFRFAPGACPATVAPGARLTAQPRPAGPALAGGEGASYCLQVTLASNVAASTQGTTLVPAFTLTLSATQEVSP